MKLTGSGVLSALLCVVLVAGAVSIGAYKGWSQEREEALAASAPQGDLAAYLEVRAMDAANLAVVAARHLAADDPSLTALRDARAVLVRADASMQDKSHADRQLTAAALELSQALPALQSVQTSARDQAYVLSLTRTLCEGEDLSASLDRHAAEFNDRLAASWTGQLAMYLGVEPIAQ